MRLLHTVSPVVLGIALGYPTLLAAQTRATDPNAEIVVTANRRAQALADVGQSITVIDKAQIAARQSQAVVDLLRTVPGLTFSRNGGVGTTTGVNIRGAESDQTVVLIDGVKLNDPSAPGGGYNFGTLLVGNLERIEVLRGSQSVIWGSQAIGGVINLLTAQPTEALQVNARIEYGSRDTRQAVANVSARVGPAALSVGAGWFDTDGISVFSEARGGRERDGYRNFGANGKAVVDLSDAVSVDLRAFYSDGRTAIDGFPAPVFSLADTREIAFTKEFVGYGGLNVALFEGRLKNRFAFATTRIDRRNVDPGSTPQVTFATQGRNERFEYQGVLELGERLGATFGAETERSSFVSTSSGGTPSRARARLSSVYAEATVKPVAGLALTAGVRHDDHSSFGGATTAAASGVFSPNDGRTRLRASYGEGFKAPSLFQLFSAFGNTRLVPERAKSWDAGIVQSLLDRRIEAGLTYFHRDTTNQIDFVSCFQNTAPICVGRPSGTYGNTRLTRAEGIEAMLTLRPVEGLRVAGQASLIDATDRVSGRRLARRPMQTVSAIIDWRARAGWSVGATIAHVGNSFDNAANTNTLASHALVDLRAAVPVTPNLELYGRVENLFDEVYETVLRYGTPRRAAYVGVRLRL